MRPVLRAFLAAIVVVSLGTAAGCRRTDPAAAATSEAGARAGRPPFGGDFTLTTHNGQTFRLADVRGRPVLMFFGYTFCPDMCPMTIARIKAALDDLGGRAPQVAVLFVSLDPKRDTPPVLAAYVRHFSPQIVGLTGTDEEIARVARQYHVSYEVLEAGSPDYLLNHTTAIFLIDKHGRLVNYYPYDERPERLAASVQAVLDGD